MEKAMPKKPVKAYKNLPFLNSPDARLIRMLSEYQEPLSRFRRFGIADTIVFFGSARTRSSDLVRKDINKLKKLSAQDMRKNRRALAKLNNELEMARYYDDAVVLARKLTEWSKTLKKVNGALSLVQVGAEESWRRQIVERKRQEGCLLDSI